MKRFFKTAVTLILIVFFGLSFTACSLFKPKTHLPVVSGDLSINFLELGNASPGDCTYIQYGNIDILIDAGSTAGSAATITSYINAHSKDGTLEYVIATHNHSDHVAAFGGTNGVLSKFPVETIIDFDDRTDSTSNAAYRTKRDELIANGTRHYTGVQCFEETNEAKRIWPLGDGVYFEILYNYYFFNNANGNENNYSIPIMLVNGDEQYLFTGDMEKPAEDAMVNFYNNPAQLSAYHITNHPNGLGKVRLMKAGHHCSSTANNEMILNAVRPDIMVIMAVAGGQYDFPSQDAINRIAKITSEVYITTMKTQDGFASYNGNVVYTVTNGIGAVNCSNNNMLLKDSPWFIENRTMPPEWAA